MHDFCCLRTGRRGMVSVYVAAVSILVVRGTSVVVGRCLVHWVGV